MQEFEIPININECLEIDFKTESKPKRRRAKDEYDLDDDMIEALEDEDIQVELEPFIENFFAYAGPVGDPKKILKDYESKMKEYKIRRVKAVDFVIDTSIPSNSEINNLIFKDSADPLPEKRKKRKSTRLPKKSPVNDELTSKLLSKLPVRETEASNNEKLTQQGDFESVSALVSRENSLNGVKHRDVVNHHAVDCASSPRTQGSTDRKTQPKSAILDEQPLLKKSAHPPATKLNNNETMVRDNESRRQGSSKSIIKEFSNVSSSIDQLDATKIGSIDDKVPFTESSGSVPAYGLDNTDSEIRKFQPVRQVSRRSQHIASNDPIVQNIYPHRSGMSLQGDHTDSSEPVSGTNNITDSGGVSKRMSGNRRNSVSPRSGSNPILSTQTQPSIQKTPKSIFSQCTAQTGASQRARHKNLSTQTQTSIGQTSQPIFSQNTAQTRMPQPANAHSGDRPGHRMKSDHPQGRSMSSNPDSIDYAQNTPRQKSLGHQRELGGNIYAQTVTETETMGMQESANLRHNHVFYNHEGGSLPPDRHEFQPHHLSTNVPRAPSEFIIFDSQQQKSNVERPSGNQTTSQTYTARPQKRIKSVNDKKIRDVLGSRSTSVKTQTTDIKGNRTSQSTVNTRKRSAGSTNVLISTSVFHETSESGSTSLKSETAVSFSENGVSQPTLNPERKSSRAKNNIWSTSLPHITSDTDLIVGQSTRHQNAHQGEHINVSANGINSFQDRNIDTTNDLSATNGSHPPPKGSPITHKEKQAIQDLSQAQSTSADAKKGHKNTISPLRCEYLIRNELIKDQKGLCSSVKNTQEFFLNECVIRQTISKEKIITELKSLDTSCLDNDRLYQKLRELEAKFDVQTIKLEEFIKFDIFNDEFMKDLWEYSDLFFKITNLKNYLKGDKLLSENILRKRLNNRLETLRGVRHDLSKHWNLKLVVYKKKTYLNLHKDIIARFQSDTDT